MQLSSFKAHSVLAGKPTHSSRTNRLIRGLGRKQQAPPCRGLLDSVTSLFTPGTKIKQRRIGECEECS